MPEYPLYEQHVRQLYRLLRHEGSFSQLHCQDVGTGKPVSRELVNGEEAVVAWAKVFNGRGNCFLGRNPRSEQGNTVCCTTLSLDLDPTRPKGEAATDIQHQATLNLARRIQQSFGYGTITSSGNGALMLFPLREPVSVEDGERLGKALEALARQIVEEQVNETTTQVTIDSTFDAPRLAKLLGTISTKGDPSLWRQARFIDPPNPNYGNYDAFIQRLEAGVGIPAKAGPSFVPPPVEKGELDRSTADFSLASRLQLQGFTAEDTYRALCANGFRPGREDDYKRIVNKLYFNQRNSGEVRPSSALQLWDPSNGLSEYRSRVLQGEPELPTGFAELDRATFGLIRGHIFTVGARTNAGKTTFAITVAANLCRLRKRLLYVSTETQFSEIWDRYIAASTGVPAFKIQHGLMSSEDQKVVNAFHTEFQDQQFIVYDGSRPNISILTQAVEQAKPDVLVMDYFQHVEGRETRELEQFVMNLKELAKTSNTAILMCAQLHDGYPDQKTGKVPAPTMRDIKNCKVLNDESRVVVPLDWDRDSQRGDGPVVVKGILAKNKGPKNDVLLRLARQIPRFEDEV